MNRRYGLCVTTCSAIFFGLAPSIAKFASFEGCNGITSAFLRGLFATPVLLIILFVRKTPLRVERKDWGPLLYVGIVGMGLTTLLLYASYDYIPTGLATTLHFSYPLLTNLWAIVFFGEKPTRARMAALGIGTLGILLSMEIGGSQRALLGFLFALFSGITYSTFIILVDKSGLKDMDFFKLSFYLSIPTAVVPLLWGTCTAQINMKSLSWKAWLLGLLLAVLISVIAQSLFQVGIRYIGASTASILSTLEPVTGILMGAALFSETLTTVKYVGCICVLASVTLITLTGEKAPEHVPETQIGNEK